MNKKTLQYLALSEDNLRKAEQKFLDTLPYDDGLPARRHSDRYYDFGGIMGAVGTIGKSVLQDGLDTTYEEVKKNKEYNDRMALSNISDNSALLSAAENLQWGQKMSAKDFRSTSALDDISDSIMAGVSGAASTGSLWGLLAALPVAGKKLFDRFRAKNEAEKWNSDLSGYNRRLANSLSQIADKVDTMNDRKLLEAFYNSAAFGGTLSTHGADWDNGLTFINAGGTHESNPNDGVPAGKDENGTPNLVEEGEVIWNNEYVFSNRLKVPQKLRNKYKLGSPITYADAVKKLTKESEERKNDPISNTTNKAIVNEFIDSQEEVRAKKQQRAAERLQQAQYENELLNAIAGLGAEQTPTGPVDMQMPAQEVPQEAPVIEQMGAYGGNLFGGGGPYTTRRASNGIDWVVVDKNGDRVGSAFRNKADALKDMTQRNSTTSTSRTPSLQEELARIEEEYTPGTPAYEKAVRGVRQAAEIRERMAQGSIGNLSSEELSIPSALDLYNQQITARENADNYLRSLGFKNPKNVRIGQLNPDQRAAYRAYLRGDTPKEESADVSTQQPQSEQVQNIGSTPSYSRFNVSRYEEPDESAEKAEQERQRKLAEQKAKEEADRKRKEQEGRGNQGGGQGSGSSGKLWHDKSLTKEQAYEFEHQPYYQEFLAEMSKNPELANEWRQRLNKGEFGSLNGYVIPDYKDWEDNATDKLIGHIHNATLKAAQEWGKRQPFNHPGKINNGLEDAFNRNVPTKATTNTAGLLGERPVSPRPDIFEDAENVTGSRTPFDWRREAPIIGGALQSILGLAGEPDYTNADAVLSAAERLGSRVNIPVETIGDIIKRRPYDERYMVNLANQNKAAAERGAANTAGGNRAMQLGADAFLAHSNQADLAEIMRQAYLANRQDEFSTAEFNRGTRLQNMSAINSRNLAEAQLNSQRQQAAFNGTLYGRNMRQQIYDRDVATTGANLSNLFNNLSLRGKEAITDRMVESMHKQGYYPYKMNPDGTIEFAPIENRTEKNGGKLKKKRRF